MNSGIDWDQYDHGPGSEEHKHRMAEERRACEARYRERQGLLEELGKAALAWLDAKRATQDISIEERQDVWDETFQKEVDSQNLLIEMVDKFNEVQ